MTRIQGAAERRTLYFVEQPLGDDVWLFLDIMGKDPTEITQGKLRVVDDLLAKGVGTLNQVADGPLRRFSGDPSSGSLLPSMQRMAMALLSAMALQPLSGRQCGRRLGQDSSRTTKFSEGARRKISLFTISSGSSTV